MKKRIFTLILFGIVLNSCMDNWGDRFNQELPDQTVWEIISTSPEYSQFAALISETGFDSILNRNSVNTVLIPPANTLDALSELDSSDKRNLIAYHISNSILYSSDIQDISSLKTLIGKQIFIENKEGVLTLNQDIGFVKTDIRALNGVIHEIDAPLVIRPSLLSIIEDNEEFSYIRDFILEGTELFFDEENSVQIGLDTIGRNIYDSVWISTNDFFSQYANLSSEDDSYTLFLADNTTLDTALAGELKGGYLATLPSYILKGVVYADELSDQLTTVNGKKLFLTSDDVELYANASNGIAYKLKKLYDLPIPQTFIWEFSDVADFDSIRGIATTDYLEYYSMLEELRVLDLDGGFAEFKYEKKSGTYNGDYLKIRTTPGTDAVLEFDLPDILPANYKVSINATLRVVDGIRYDAYLNDELISSGNNFNGGTYKFELREVGQTTVENESGNVFRMVIDGTSSSTVFCYIDYLKFEPIK